MDVIKNIAAIVGCIISIITLLTICSKNGRAVITFFFKENTKEIRNKAAVDTIKQKIKINTEIFHNKLFYCLICLKDQQY